MRRLVVVWFSFFFTLCIFSKTQANVMATSGFLYCNEVLGLYRTITVPLS